MHGQTTITMTEFRRDLAGIARRVRRTGNLVWVTKNGRPYVVLAVYVVRPQVENGVPVEAVAPE